MNDITRVELAVRRAAGQMPNHQSRAFRLLANELASVSLHGNKDDYLDNEALKNYRKNQSEID